MVSEIIIDRLPFSNFAHHGSLSIFDFRTLLVNNLWSKDQINPHVYRNGIWSSSKLTLWCLSFLVLNLQLNVFEQFNDEIPVALSESSQLHLKR